MVLPGREYMADIRLQWLFYVLAGLAVAVFLGGVAIKVRGWLDHRAKTGPEGPVWPRPGRIVGILLADVLLTRRLFRARASAGTAHLLIMWGFLGLFLGTVAISVDHYLVSFLSGRVYLVFSLILEFLGLALIVGLVWVLIRRYLLRPERLERRTEDLLLPLLLLVIAITGFLLEGARLAAENPAWAGLSFVGSALAGLWGSAQGAGGAHPVLWWLHAVASLGLIAWLPFSKLFHSLAGPVSLALQDLDLDPDLSDEEEEEDLDENQEEGEEDSAGSGPSLREAIHLDACTRCGLCLEVCPANGAGEPIRPRNVLDLLRKGPDQGVGSVWYCTTCRACFQVCPVAVAPLAIIRLIRSAVVEEGQEVPPMLGESLEKLYKYANPWQAKKNRKDDWAQGLDLEGPGSEDRPSDLLYFVGCTTSIETRAQGLARSLAAILRAAGEPFATLGKKEPCCGDIARQLGEYGLFADQRDKTLRSLGKRGLGRIVTSSPHCYDALAKVYPKALETKDGEIALEPMHYSLLLARLLEQGRLPFSGEVKMRATYHDPCYLARHNGILEEPRRLLRAVPGLELVEMEAHGLGSLCCGGGGGRMWQELEEQALPDGSSMSQRRLAQARATGAELVVTACPLCLIMLEDGRKTGGFEDSLRIMDLAELIALAMGLDDKEES